MTIFGRSVISAAYWGYMDRANIDNEPDEPEIVKCPYCDHSMDVLGDNTRVCPNCRVSFPNITAVERERAKMAAGYRGN